MKTILMTTALILVLAMPVLAGETLPAQAQRIWAPTGDLIGLQNHATASLIFNDRHGDQDKAAEDWSIYGKTFGYGLFGYHSVSDNGYDFAVRGDLGNVAGSGLAGNFGLWASAPGQYKVRILYNKHDHYYDRDSELRNPAFPYPPAPQMLENNAHLDWRRGRLDLGWHVSSAFDVAFGLIDMRRLGDKGSLLRGVSGEAPPGVLTQDTDQFEVYLGGTFKSGRFGSELMLSLRNGDGRRNLVDIHDYADDRTSYRGSLDLSYDVSSATRIVGYGTLGQLESTGIEEWRTNSGQNDGTMKDSAGLLAVQSRLGRQTNFLVSARFSGTNKETQINETSGVLNAGTRDQSRQDYRIEIGNTSLPKTRLRLQYRYGSGTVEDVTTAGGLTTDPSATDYQRLDQDRSRQDLDFRARTTFSRGLKLKIGVNYRSLDVEETVDGDWYGTLGDHNRDRWNWTVALKTRPMANLPIDLGYQGVDQSFERTSGEVAKTTWQANRLFLNVNWIANARFSFYGMVNYGQEKYQLTDVAEPTAGMGAYDYDGTTWRFVPGAVLHVTRTLQLDGMWEGIRYENTGNEGDFLNPVKADHDRWLARLAWQANETLAVTATYRRNEFDENRWDDYIQDLWSLSLSGVF